jgi:O-methyltransferase involved in polyketide biosynthesis
MVVDHNTLLLGRAVEQSGSELQAGTRAELAPTPITQALASLQGRVTAKVLARLVQKEALNFITGRTPALLDVMRRTVPPGVAHPLLVDVGVGYSPLTLQLAEALPQARVVEIDLPAVIEERQRRLSRAKIALPSNIRTLAVDLRHTALNEILDSEQPHGLTFTGAYLTHEEQASVLGALRRMLAYGGAVVCMLPWEDGLRQVEQAARLFKRTIGELPGVMRDEASIRAVFAQAGYRDVTIYRLAESLRLKTPVIDLEVIALGRR